MMVTEEKKRKIFNSKPGFAGIATISYRPGVMITYKKRNCIILETNWNYKPKVQDILNKKIFNIDFNDLQMASANYELLAKKYNSEEAAYRYMYIRPMIFGDWSIEEIKEHSKEYDVDFYATYSWLNKFESTISIDSLIPGCVISFDPYSEDQKAFYLYLMDYLIKEKCVLRTYSGLPIHEAYSLICTECDKYKWKWPVFNEFKRYYNKIITGEAKYKTKRSVELFNLIIKHRKELFNYALEKINAEELAYYLLVELCDIKTPKTNLDLKSLQIHVDNLSKSVGFKKEIISYYERIIR